MRYRITTKLAMAIGIVAIGWVSGIQAAVPQGCRQFCAAKTCQMSCQQCCNQKWARPENAQKKKDCFARCQKAGKR
jgi:hypothetical protein